MKKLFTLVFRLLVARVTLHVAGRKPNIVPNRQNFDAIGIEQLIFRSASRFSASACADRRSIFYSNSSSLT